MKIFKVGVFILIIILKEFIQLGLICFPPAAAGYDLRSDTLTPRGVTAGGGMGVEGNKRKMCE